MDGKLTRTTSFHSAAHLLAGTKTPLQKPLPGRVSQLSGPPSSPSTSCNGVGDQKTSLHRGNEGSQPQLQKSGATVLQFDCSKRPPPSIGGGTKEDSLTTGGDGKSGGTNGTDVRQQKLISTTDPSPTLPPNFQFTPQEKAIRSALLEEMEEHDKSVLDHTSTRMKARYNYLTASAVVAATETTFILNTIALDTGAPTIATRMGNSIRCHRLKGRIAVLYGPSAVASTTALTVPNIRIVIHREKVCAIAATPAVAFADGQNPPSGATYAPFNRLAQAATVIPASMLAVRDPFSFEEFAVYYDHHYKPSTMFPLYSNFAGPLGSFMDNHHYIDLDIDLGGFKTIYSNDAGTQQIANRLCIAFILDQALATNGGSVTATGSLVLSFTDDTDQS